MNKKSFRNEIKTIFGCFISAVFKTYKTNQQKYKKKQQLKT